MDLWTATHNREIVSCLQSIDIMHASYFDYRAPAIVSALLTCALRRTYPRQPYAKL
jgi:hypothetical protein